MNPEKAQTLLYGLRNRGSSYGLERMVRFAEALGHPERAYPTVQVAGTNGKGSVCAMVAAVFRTAGYRVGLYTSPHLVDLGERVRVNGEILSDQAIADYTAELLPVAEAVSRENPDLHPTFFEFMTAMAFLHFRREKVDLGVFETGLGGRLDATTVLQPEVTAITSIGLDHTELLGDTIEAIAAEKAGILKEGVPMVLGRLPAAAETVVRERADTCHCKVINVGEVFGPRVENYPDTNLPSSFQRVNAATAALVVRELKSRLPCSAEALEKGLKRVDWPGRWQRMEVAGRTLILDATHNPEGADMLRENLEALRRQGGKAPWIITGTLGEERARALMPVVADFARGIWLVQPAQPRACPPSLLASFLGDFPSEQVHLSQVGDLFPAPGTCVVGEPGDTVVVTGSIYLIGEILEHLRRGPGSAGAGLQDLP